MVYERKEPWLKYLELTVVITVIVAIYSTYKSTEYTNQSVSYQEQAYKKWIAFQSISVKLNVYESQNEILVLESRRIQKWEKIAQQMYWDKILENKETLKKSDTEKLEIKKDAENFESLSNQSRKHASEFGIALIYFLISILVSAITAFNKKKYLWIIGIIVGFMGMFYFLNGFLLFI